MKYRSCITRMLCLLLSSVLLLSLAGCASHVQAADLMEGIERKLTGDVSPVDDESAEKAADFSVRLLKACHEDGKNLLVSPLSVLAALSMTANGASGNTLSEMEQVLGMPVQELNTFFRSTLDALSKDEEAALRLADSIWITSDGNFSVKQDFLQTNADYYDADAYRVPFNTDTLRDINRWVKEQTKGMIPEILDRIPENAVMYLVNALAFEAEWMSVYDKDHVRTGTFTSANGAQQEAVFMYSTEEKYLENAFSEGFLKYYSGGRYAFAALLPKEGFTLDTCIASLEGRGLHEMLTSPVSVSVLAAIPKFETKYDAELSGVLSDMGMPSAFLAGYADFSGLSDASPGDIYISRVLHKTFIQVAEQGTKAGAATVVEMARKSAPFVSPDTKEVYLDRPFIYMLIDTETRIPFFIGAMNDLQE